MARGSSSASFRINGFGDVIWNQGVLDEILTSPQGYVGKDLARRGAKVASKAKETLTVEGHVDTGRLRSSITFLVYREGKSVVCDVGSNVEYAGIIESRYPYLRPSLSAASGI